MTLLENKDIEKRMEESAIIRRTEKITFRVTPKELQEIQKKANQSSMKMSEYLRYSSLNAEIIIIEDIKELSRELKAVGNNLNQALVLAHQGKIQSINIVPTKQQVDKIWQLFNLLFQQTNVKKG